MSNRDNASLESVRNESHPIGKGLHGLKISTLDQIIITRKDIIIL